MILQLQIGDSAPKTATQNLDLCTCSACKSNPCDVTVHEFGDGPIGDRNTCCKKGNTNPTCYDKDGYGVGSDPNPVTDQECGTGWHYDATKADRCLAPISWSCS